MRQNRKSKPKTGARLKIRNPIIWPAKPGNRDANEPEIIGHAVALGGLVIIQPPGNGYDFELKFRGKSHVIEVKTEDAIPASGDRVKALTPNEKSIRILMLSMGIPYHIVISAEEIQKIMLEGAVIGGNKINL